jgi:transcription initiation factor TFIID subunit 5
MLRQESRFVDRDGKPMQERAEDSGTAKYAKAFRLLNSWIDGNLDFYKVGGTSEAEII